MTPLGAAAAFAAMLMAVVKFHWKNGFSIAHHGFEYPLSLLIVSIAIGLIGPGSYSLDALFGIALPETLLFGVLAVAALLVDVKGGYAGYQPGISSFLLFIPFTLLFLHLLSIYTTRYTLRSRI